MSQSSKSRTFQKIDDIICQCQEFTQLCTKAGGRLFEKRDVINIDLLPPVPPPTMDSPPTKTKGHVSTPPYNTNGFLHPTSPPASLTPRLLPIQIIILAIYPITVVLGLVSNHPQDSYFARKDNLINVYLLKFAWFWATIAFFVHVVRVPKKLGPLVRYLAATIVWYLVTQWCFGPPIMDKLFRGTGGICQIALPYGRGKLACSRNF